ncbi:hypothetical protein EVAR_47636_1 [Eumeta japonica]|uniref:Folded gastrulation N-terminal domain-containing protein n=1 Tax=Eumeta variegata TaxID=151549 RepID=A0A4C1ZBU4_EUMVA|nr:hypothetical protein EVAR_47636_1 [Eumeta japonica]
MFQLSAMWRTWIALALVWCAHAEQAITVTSTSSEERRAEGPPASTSPPAEERGPPRTLDRQAAELAWRAWLQSAESKDPSAPPRRITTKSLFITPFNCPKGQRLDRDGCITEVTITEEEQERLLVDHLNALFTAPPGEEYDYGDSEPGPLQLSIPLALEAAPLQSQEPQSNLVKIDKKEDGKSDSVDASIEAELELLKLQSPQTNNDTVLPDKTSSTIHSVLNNYIPSDKPKRDSSNVNVTDVAKNITSEGQKEVVFGHVSVDPVLSETDYNNQDAIKNSMTVTQNINSEDTESGPTNIMTYNHAPTKNNESATEFLGTEDNISTTNDTKNKTLEEIQLKPENEYPDIGEAIKLISRYAEVTTDDSFTKDKKKYAYDNREDTFLGTRTKLQHRRNRPKPLEIFTRYNVPNPSPYDLDVPLHNVYPKQDVYRYPWASQSITPPPDYPFKHLQDYWAGRDRGQGLYNVHENPRRHHHSYPYSFRPHGYAEPYGPRLQPSRTHSIPLHRVVQRRVDAGRPRTNTRDLYSLLGLRHWFSSESAAKR